jgi:hypothetical protein
MPDRAAPAGKAPATEKIEITPEMIEAGASVLCRFETFTAGESYWAEEVYKAMASRRPSSAF